ncbi:ChbG/HpnK family deacetylase [Paenibacillus albus]|uniref:ChbG/HpnK family deacetylase n=1 Tax=Paenibacillus albus TaxID=2495582 RepID=A0A3S8ZXS0_9BACL|nr:ChbG/HpnK family deacetylase [Paenibacillus albus]AZN38252.1 ChbG/HpnK family deacetylase [Paenibacillus albus]
MNTNEQQIRLITRADDAGSARTADRAILDAIEGGIVRNVSLMAVGPTIEHAAELLAARRDVCFGIHGTLNAEWTDVRWGPILGAAKVPSLVESDTGMFTPTPAHFLNHPPVIDEVMAELQAQLDRLRSLGFNIGYADSHMVFEWAIPQIAEPFDRWCEREGIRNYRRYSKQLPEAAAAGADMESDPVTALIKRLKQAEPGQYLIVGHPGYDEADMLAFGNADYKSEQIVADRINERLMFMREDVLACVKERGIVPIRYDEAAELE